MSTTLIASLDAPFVPPRKRWTREECQVLQNTGLLEAGRYELIEGDLIPKMGKNRPHVLLLGLLVDLLKDVFGKKYVHHEAPIDVSHLDNAINEPEPDITVLRRPRFEIRDRNPLAEEVTLAVEVSNSTLAFDLRTKARLYARAGIADYWVIDVNQRRVIVHRDPVGDGYQSVVAYHESEEVRPLDKPEAVIRVADVFQDHE